MLSMTPMLEAQNISDSLSSVGRKSGTTFHRDEEE